MTTTPFQKLGNLQQVTHWSISIFCTSEAWRNTFQMSGREQLQQCSSSSIPARPKLSAVYKTHCNDLLLLCQERLWILQPLPRGQETRCIATQSVAGFPSSWLGYIYSYFIAILFYSVNPGIPYPVVLWEYHHHHFKGKMKLLALPVMLTSPKICSLDGRLNRWFLTLWIFTFPPKLIFF